MKVSRPLSVTLPSSGVYFAESVHAQDFSMAARADPYHKLLYVYRGRLRYEEAGRSAEAVPAGGLVVVPGHVRHRLVDEEPSTLLLLCLADTWLRRETELAALWRGWTAARQRHVAVSGPQRRHVENCWRHALGEQAQERPGRVLALRALALQVFVQLARLPNVASADDTRARVALVAREIQGTFFERWTLDGAAARAGISRRHFSTHFRAATGRTFWAYLTELRLAHAAELLRRGEHSVTGVIFACGFGDVSQFYRLFRARFGQTPKAWRGCTNSPAILK